jgi:hypothetical protein
LLITTYCWICEVITMSVLLLYSSDQIEVGSLAPAIGSIQCARRYSSERWDGHQSTPRLGCNGIYQYMIMVEWLLYLYLCICVYTTQGPWTCNTSMVECAYAN